MSSALAQHNAHLTRIAGGGTSEDYDQPAGSDTARWTGSEEAHVTELVVEQVDGTGLNQVKETRVLIPSTVQVVPDTGDTVTYSVNGTETSREVQQVEDHSSLGFYRLRFWNV